MAMHFHLTTARIEVNLASAWSAAIPNWVTALATVGALVAASFAGWTATRLYRTERERDERLERAERSWQASQIVAWASWAKPTDPGIALNLAGGRTSQVHLALRNASGVPVYDVQVFWSCEGQALGDQPLPMLSPTGDHPHEREIKCKGVAELVQRPDRAARIDIRAAIEFTDAAGVRWRRGGDGRLLEIAR